MFNHSKNAPKNLDSLKRSDELEKINSILCNHLDENKELVNFSKDKDILLLIGNTGSGKTSLISYLTGIDLNY